MRPRLLLALLPLFACNKAGDAPASGLWVFEVSVLDSNSCGSTAPHTPDGNFQITVTDDGAFELDYYQFDDPLACTYRDNAFDCPERVISTVSDASPSGMKYELTATRNARVEGAFEDGAMVGTLSVRIACEGPDCSLFTQALNIPALPCLYGYTFAADGPGD